MKRIILSIAASWMVAGCMSPETMISQARASCAAIGYTVDSPEFLRCVERDVADTQAIMQSAFAASAVNASSMVIADALFQ